MTTLAVIVGNRGFFPSHLAKTGRETILRVLDEEGFGAVCLTPDDTEHGAVVSFEDSVKCAELFKAHAEEIDGILVTLPNFGEERGIAAGFLDPAKPPAGTLLPCVGLPSLDAGFAIDAVAVPANSQ